MGLAWRPETAWLIQQRDDLGMTEVLVENFPTPTRAHQVLIERGTPIVPHGVSLGLGDAARPDPRRLRRLAEAAVAYRSPLVSEHVAFVRGGGTEVGHLLPVPRSREALRILVANVRIAQAELPVPLAVENIAAPLGWPDDELDDAEFLADLVDATGVGLVLDLANLHANATNRGVDPERFLDRIPLAAVAYLHVAGGTTRGRWYHDTHAHPISTDPLRLLAHVRARGVAAPVLLERDGAFPTESEIEDELWAIALASGADIGPTPSTRTAHPVDAGAPPDRSAMERRQAELVHRLVLGRGDPEGFDPEALAVTARSLADKRERRTTSSLSS